MTFNSTDEYIQEQIRRLNDYAKESNNAGFYAVAGSTHGEVIERIFDDGLASDGTKIGEYSTKPISISKSKQVVKTGQSYFKGGYKEYRDKAGRQTEYVDLALSTQLRREFSTNVEFNEGAWTWSIVQNKDKANGNEKRFGKKIFSLTADEAKRHSMRIERKLIMYLNGQ